MDDERRTDTDADDVAVEPVETRDAFAVTAAGVAGAQGGASEQGRAGGSSNIVGNAALGTVPGTGDEGAYEGGDLPPEETDPVDSEGSADPRSR